LTKANEIKPTLKVLIHEIRIRNQVMYLDPPVEQARVSWYSQLHEWLSVVCTLTRIQSSRYEIDLAVQDNAGDLTYSDLVSGHSFVNYTTGPL
jgi:dynein heavy chain 1